MNKRFLVTCVFVGMMQWAFAQNAEISKSYADQVSAADLKEYLTILSSDALEGRKTGTRGQKMAAAFIANHFREIGLRPLVNGGYYQPVGLFSNSISEAWVRTGATRYDNLGEVLYFGSGESDGEISTDVVFIGRGSDEDVKKIEIKGKAVVVLTGKLESMQSARKLSQSAQDHGARMVLVLSESSPAEFQETVGKMKGFASSSRLSLQKPDPSAANQGVFLINHSVSEKIFGTTFEKLKTAADDPKHEKLKKIKATRITYAIHQKSEVVNAENIIGYLEGTDKKDEVVLVTAHFDHIGTSASGDDKINNGADDDGSGTVSVLEIAKTFAKAKKDGHGPRRSMVFMTVVGEEQGLLG